MMAQAVALHAAAVLADTTPDGPEDKKATALGLAVILVLAAVCYFLFRSMLRHLRKVRDEFPGQQRPHRPVDLAKPGAKAATPPEQNGARPSVGRVRAPSGGETHPDGDG